MPDEEMSRRIEERLEELDREIADLKAVYGAAADLLEDAENGGGVFGLSRLRSVRRMEGHPGEEGDEE